jgi:hypothetical protein
LGVGSARPKGRAGTLKEDAEKLAGNRLERIQRDQSGWKELAEGFEESGE